MSVPKNKRTKSELEFYDKGIKICDNLTKFMINDFGIKSLNKSTYDICRNANMDEDDMKEFIMLAERYDIKVTQEFPMWLLEHYRNTILACIDDFMNNMSTAYGIFPNTMDEFNMRRSYQSRAITAMQLLKQIMQTVIRNFPINMEKYVPFVKQIDEEIIKLKDWRKNGNKQREQCLINDEENRQRAAVKLEKRKRELFIASIRKNASESVAFLSRVNDITSGFAMYNQENDKDIMDYAYANYCAHKYTYLTNGEGFVVGSSELIPAILREDNYHNVLGPLY